MIVDLPSEFEFEKARMKVTVKLNVNETAAWYAETTGEVGYYDG